MTVADLYDALITDSRCLNTRNARDHDIRVFAAFLGLPTTGPPARSSHPRDVAQPPAVAMAFRQHEMERGHAATVNRKLATLRRLIKLARRLGVLEWSLEVDDLRSVTVRDTRGPALDEWRQLWEMVRHKR